MTDTPDGTGLTEAHLTLIKLGRALSYLAWFWVLATLVILGLGFILLLLGANPNAGFVEWAYRALDRSMTPFRGIFEPITLGGQSVFETSILFAMVVYSIVGLAVRALLDWLSLKMVRLDAELRWHQDQERIAAQQREIERRAAAAAEAALGWGQGSVATTPPAWTPPPGPTPPPSVPPAPGQPGTPPR
ncbi:MAG TPA: hypothetical protein VK866_07425 [Acidimicrobiales bacterium]|nr:hypothetical protein [Acidimicrobiales bacterium]